MEWNIAHQTIKHDEIYPSAIVLPVITQLGYSPVWFGVWFILVGTSGLITPPFGISLFVLKSVVPKHDIVTIALGVFEMQGLWHSP